MPRKTKPTALADQAAQPQFHIPAELLDQLVTGPMTPGQPKGCSISSRSQFLSGRWAPR